MSIDSIIFDLDGTLWDSSEGVSKTWSLVLNKYDYERKEVTVEDLHICMGKQLDEIGEILFPNLSSEVRKNLMHECCTLENEYLGEHGGKLYLKVEETLKELSKKYKLFIVSNCQDGYIECFFKAHKLDKYFTDYECPGRTGLSKGENNKLIIENDCTPISNEHLEHIFEAFYRVEFDRNKSSGGNGLGLYIVQQILTTTKLTYSFKPIKNGMKFEIDFNNKNII